jgi:hypothetical protein
MSRSSTTVFNWHPGLTRQGYFFLDVFFAAVFFGAAFFVAAFFVAILHSPPHLVTLVDYVTSDRLLVSICQQKFTSTFDSLQNFV